MPTRVTNVEFDGSSVILGIGALEVEALKLNYGDSLKPEKVRPLGQQRIGALTPGEYDVSEGGITLRNSVWCSDVLPRLVDGFGNVPLDITVSVTHPEIGFDSDFLEGARITNIEAAKEAGAKGLEVELKIQPIQIWWGTGRVRINFGEGFPPGIAGALGFQIGI